MTVILKSGEWGGDTRRAVVGVLKVLLALTFFFLPGSPDSDLCEVCLLYTKLPQGCSLKPALTLLAHLFICGIQLI